jgi:membrane-bound serine protease (ClpP class)
MTNFLIEQNVAYLLLMSSAIMGVLALYAPGTGLIELGAIFTLVLAGYGLYNLPVNSWAFIFLLVGIAPFLLPLFWKKPLSRTQDIAIVLGSFVALVVGSIFLVRNENGAGMINPFVIILASAFTAGIFWLISHKGLEAMRRRPAHDLNHFGGMTGTATTDIFEVGSVYAAGEQWSARSKIKIPAGSQVRILKRDGFTLEVEILEQEKPSA